MEQALEEFRRHRVFLYEELERKSKLLNSSSTDMYREDYRRFVYGWMKVLKDVNEILAFLEQEIATTK